MRWWFAGKGEMPFHTECLGWVTCEYDLKKVRELVMQRSGKKRDPVEETAGTLWTFSSCSRNSKAASAAREQRIGRRNQRDYGAGERARRRLRG